jgi:hypothetical protein
VLSGQFIKKSKKTTAMTVKKNHISISEQDLPAIAIMALPEDMDKDSFDVGLLMKILYELSTEERYAFLFENYTFSKNENSLESKEIVDGFWEFSADNHYWYPPTPKQTRSYYEYRIKNRLSLKNQELVEDFAFEVNVRMQQKKKGPQAA